MIEVNNHVELDKPLDVNQNGTVSIQDKVEQCCYDCIESTIIAEDSRKELIEMVNSLPSMEFEVICRMYGLFKNAEGENIAPIGLRDTGIALGYSHETIRKFRDSGLRLLSKMIKNKAEEG